MSTKALETTAISPNLCAALTNGKACRITTDGAAVGRMLFQR